MMTIKQAFRLVVEDAMTIGTDEFHDALYLFVQRSPAEQLVILKQRLVVRHNKLRGRRDILIPEAEAAVAVLQTEMDDIQDFIDTH